MIRMFAVPVAMWVWYLSRRLNDSSTGNKSFSSGHSKNSSVSGILVVDEDVVVLVVVDVVVYTSSPIATVADESREVHRI